MSDDEDAPPPLTSLTEQIEAVRQRGACEGDQRSELAASERSLRVASTVVVAPGATGPITQKAAVPALKKGFFNSKPAASKASTAKATAKKDQEEDVVVLKGKKDVISGAAPQIPEFMRVQPDEDDKRLLQAKDLVLQAMQPSEDMVAAVTSNATLLQGFGDPEVMAAVDEIAKNPEAMKKYKGNRKVEEFYKAMAGLAGERLHKMAEQQKP